MKTKITKRNYSKLGIKFQKRLTPKITVATIKK